MNNQKREISRKKRHKRFTVKVAGTAERPRLLVHRSLNNLWAHLIDDTASRVLLTVSTTEKEVKSKFSNSGNVKAADFFGQFVANKAKEKGISKIIFDRAGYLYHGRIKAFADSLRKGGVEF
ncbi:MAG: 50S ribosomal protein L18 [Candidatus Omnitrophota bacterium]|jgi:large subunit ribosomal protein L18